MIYSFLLKLDRMLIQIINYKLLFLTAVFDKLFTNDHTKSVVIECGDYKSSDDSSSYFNFWTTCNVTNKLNVGFPYIKVSDFTLTRGSKSRSSAINGFYLNDAPELIYIPYKLKEHFKNLKAVQISNSGLTSLTQKDIDQLGENLEYVNFSNNKYLLSIHSEIFENQRSLSYVDFENTRLRYLHSDFIIGFGSLKKIIYVNFKNSGCLNIKFENITALKIKNIWNICELFQAAKNCGIKKEEISVHCVPKHIQEKSENDIDNNFFSQYENNTTRRYYYHETDKNSGTTLKSNHKNNKAKEDRDRTATSTTSWSLDKISSDETYIRDAAFLKNDDEETNMNSFTMKILLIILASMYILDLIIATTILCVFY